MVYSGRSGDRYTRLGAQTRQRSKSTFQVFFFQLYFNKKYVKVAINDFTMYLIISKWLRIKKCRQKRKSVRQKGRSERRNCQRKCFYLIRNRSHKYLLFLLRKQFTLLRVITCVLLADSFCYSHTHFLFTVCTSTAAVHNSQNPESTTVFCYLLSHAFPRCQRGSPLSQIFTYATVSINVVIIIFLPRLRNELSSSYPGHKFCIIFPFTYIYIQVGSVT